MKTLILLLTLFAATPANAAPVGMVIGAIAGALGVSAATVGLVLFNFATAIVGSAIQRMRMKKQQSGGITTERTLTGGVNSRSIILGRYATAGAEICPTYSRGSTSKTDKIYLTYVIALSDLPSDSISRIIINGEYCPITTAIDSNYGNIIGGKYLAGEVGEDNYAFIKFYDGTQTTADARMVEMFGSHDVRPWTTNHIGTGITYAILTFRYNKTLFTSEPTFRFEVNGAKLYDPRKDSTRGGSGSHRLANSATWEFTQNPMVMAYNVLLGIPLRDGNYYGANVPVDDLPLTNWVAQMNICDEPVTLAGGGTEPRYRAGYEIRVADMEPGDVLDELMKACSGELVEIGGVWKARAGGPGLPVMFIGDGDFIVNKEQELDPFPTSTEARNTLNLSYPSPVELWESHDAPTITNATYLTEDRGEVYIGEIKLPAVPFSTQVQRLGRAWLNDNRRARNHQGWLGPYAFHVEPLDVIDWTSDRNGYINKQFEVLATEENLLTLLTAVSIREVDPSDYDWTPGFELPDPVTPGGWTLPEAMAVPGFAVAPFSITDAGGTSRRAAIRCSWTVSEAPMRAQALSISIRRAGSTQEITKTVTNIRLGVVDISEGILPNTTYEVRAIYIVDRPPVVYTSWLSVITGGAKIGKDDIADEVYDEMETIADEVGKKVGFTTVSTLPATGTLNQLVYLVPPGQFYRWDGSQWVQGVYAGIPDGSLDATKFAQGIEPVTIITTATLPTTKSTTLIFWQGKTYRWNGTAYVASIPSVDLVGEIVAEQLAANAVTPEKLAVIPGHNLSPDPTILFPASWTVQAGFTHSAGRWTFDGNGITVWRFAGPTKGIAVAETLQYKLRVKVTLGTAPSTSIRLWINWYDAAGAFISTSSQNGIAVSATGFFQVIGTAPANAKTATVQVYLNGGATAGTVFVDAFEFVHVTSAETLADQAVTNAKVVAAAIDAAKLADSAATAAKIAASAITEIKIDSNAVTTAKIADAAIASGKLADEAATAAKVAANAITEIKIASTAVTTGKLADEAATVAKVAASAITEVKLGASAVTTAKIADAAIASGKLANSAATAAKVATGAITETKIGTNAVTTAKINAGAVTATEIAAGAVTAGKVAAGAIEAGAIAAGAVTATKIDAGAVTTSKLAAGAVTANEVAAGAIVATKLAITSVENIIQDAEYNDLFTYWRADRSYGTWSVAANQNPSNYGQSIVAVLRNVPEGADTWSRAISSGAFPVVPGEEFYTSHFIWNNRNAKLWVRLTFYSNTEGTVGEGFSTIFNGDVAPGTREYTASITIPANVKSARAEVYINRSILTNGLPSEYNFGRFLVRKKNDGKLIVDGAIQANHITSNAVTTDKIAAGAVTANEIAANAVTAGKINAGAVTAGTIAAGAVQAGTIAANAVTATEINAGAVTAAKINAGAVTATKIAANAVEADKIAANAVTAGKINAGAVTAGTIAAGAVQAGTIAAGAIQANDIAANAITTAKIAANAVTANEVLAGSITAVKIATDAVVAGKIAAGAVQADTIAANAITSAKIVAGSITSASLATDSVTSAKIAAGAVTADTIAANAITTGKIAAGAIGADQIAAGAIVASKLAVSDYTNLVPDSELQDVKGWNGIPNDGTGVFVLTPAGNPSVKTTGAVIYYDTRNTGPRADVTATSGISPVTSGDVLYLAGQMVRATGTTMNARIAAQFLNKDRGHVDTKTIYGINGTGNSSQIQ